MKAPDYRSVCIEVRDAGQQYFLEKQTGMEPSVEALCRFDEALRQVGIAIAVDDICQHLGLSELTDDQIREISHDFDFDGTQTDHCFCGKPLDEYWDYQGQQILAFARALLEAQRRLINGNA